MPAPQQFIPTSPLVSQPVFIVDSSGNPFTSSNLMPVNSFQQGPTHNATQTANTAGDNPIKASPGTLWSATVTTLGTAALSIYDNATTHTGTILLTIPASAPVGSIYQWNSGQPAANGITSNGVLNCPAVTFAYS